MLELARARPVDDPDRGPALQRAVDDLEELVADDPLHPRHLQRLGVALALSGRIEEARLPLERAVELAPDDPEAATNLLLVERLADDGADGPPAPDADG